MLTTQKIWKRKCERKGKFNGKKEIQRKVQSIGRGISANIVFEYLGVDIDRIAELQNFTLIEYTYFWKTCANVQPEIYLSARISMQLFDSRLLKILGHVGKLTAGYCIEKNNSEIMVTVFSSPFRFDRFD
ncbi:hypothetical protein RCL_jg2765.t2 [Rhizophagus clarus]|uniref:Uncharacterized protein n=1 Tax=Rhizophagus clarus TaxID=94130 RepID=A0A8H3M661_9GLOM|nr:hypothetical protein RCL_jg2765.t2 [Rhizophagus clarus]